MTESPEIRAATPGDWPRIWPFLRRIVAAGETFTYPRDLDESSARDIWVLTPPGHTVVALGHHGEVCGTAKMGPNHAGPSAHIATASFMVDPGRTGRGIGRALGEYALAWARANGFRAMQFNAVVETNTRAVALWESLGFEIMATVPEAFQHPQRGYVGLHIMYQRLAPTIDP